MDLARLQTPPLHQTCLQKSDLHRVRHNPAAARQLANPLMVNSGKREMRPFLLLIIQLEATQFGSPTQRCTKSKCRKAQLAASNSALHFSLIFPTQQCSLRRVFRRNASHALCCTFSKQQNVKMLTWEFLKVCKQVDSYYH